jgi:DNA-3-methyladenine glycosylase II
MTRPRKADGKLHDAVRAVAPPSTHVQAGSFSATLPVAVPYRLDLTVNALRRVSENVVDVVTGDGCYLRALRGPDGIDVIEVRQLEQDKLDVRIFGPGGRARLQTVTWMLGTDIDLRAWYKRVKAFPWLSELSRELRGLKPPRYPDLWEALCHGIVFQQLSIAAAAIIMKGMVERLSISLEHRSIQLYPFPHPQAILEASDSTMRTLGISKMKTSYLKNAATAVLDGTLRDDSIRGLPTAEAADELMRLRGIGPWSAANILLRGFGRLDTFPLADTGVAANMALLSGDPRIKADAVLDGLGDIRGLLYFHLLLGGRAMRARMRS